MTTIKVKNGLTLPIGGEPEQRIDEGPPLTQVAWHGADYPGLRPKVLVSEGEKVLVGQPLVMDKANESVVFPSPGTGRVVSIERGERRRLLSIVIDLKESADGAENVNSAHADMRGEALRELLLRTGLWTFLRQRPFDRVARPDKAARSLFVTAIDTNPLAPSLDIIVREKAEAFRHGIGAIGSLIDGPTRLCVARGSEIAGLADKNVEVCEFVGRHPAGNVGTHIHMLDPVRRDRVVWHIMAQDVIAISHFLQTGHFPTERIVSLAGPSVLRPRLLRTRRGASISQLLDGQLQSGNHRCISGSVLSGHTARGQHAWLGAFHQQVTVIPEGGERKFIGWMLPDTTTYSVTRALFSRVFPGSAFRFTTDSYGSERAIVPIGVYEQINSLDILPTPLLRALAVDDLEVVEKLGGLELVEEDIAPFTYVCPSKIDWGPILRRNLTLLEKEG